MAWTFTIPPHEPTLFCILFALLAYLRVFVLSSALDVAGDTHAIISVMPDPPRLSFNSMVSVLSRNGMCPARFLGSARLDMQ